MNSRTGRGAGSVFYETHSARGLVRTLLLSLAIIAFVMASLAIGYRSGFASGPEAGTDCLPGCPASGATSSPMYWEGDTQPDLSPGVISPVDPAIGGGIDSFGSIVPQPQPQPQPVSPDQPGGIYVWAAFLCVSEYSDAQSTYLGYMPELLPVEGSLNPATFSYLDSSRSVENLYYQETDTGVRRLVLELDEPLEIDLTLYAGNMAFPFSASTTSELGPNARVWMLDSSLGWAPGQPALIALGDKFSMPMAQAGQDEISHSLGGINCGNFSKQQFAGTVWSANLEIGRASDSSTTYLGYIFGTLDSQGELSSTTFLYGGAEYTILTLYYQEAGKIRQLVLSSDLQLPSDLILEIGGRQYPVAESLKLGADENIHAWRLASGLGWTEGQHLEVRLRQRQG